jgi:Ca2+:H+ antiporter
MFNWFFVVSIPMAKVLWTILDILIHNPTNVAILPDYSRAASFSVLLCNFRAFNVLYFEYEFKGVNIVFLNLIPIVLTRALMIVVHIFYHYDQGDNPILLFFIDLLCSIPITFYIGTSIASIAIQTNYTIGAILNASFGSITELLLFSFAIRKGALNDLILYSLTGSLLCDMLLLPGLSMIIGGIKYHEQKFNPTAASISSLLLFVAIIGAFTPTIWYHVFGLSNTDCQECFFETDPYNGTHMYCFDCYSSHSGIDHDPKTQSLKKLSYLACVVLPLIYFIGLFFTFKTHKHIFDEEGEEEGNAEWSIPFSIFVMLISITCFGLLAEDVVSLLQDVLETLGLTQAFLGITLIALTPAATEIANAIKFALLNNISLSVSIGSASSIQVALIQMPALLLLAIAFGAEDNFHLIFPLMSVFSVILAVITFNYISSEGHSNYFVGSVLVVMYILLIGSFYFTPITEPLPSFL